jgi:hypothetical protein
MHLWLDKVSAIGCNMPRYIHSDRGSQTSGCISHPDDISFGQHNQVDDRAGMVERGFLRCNFWTVGMQVKEMP